MKIFFKIFTYIIILSVGVWVQTSPVQSQQPEVSFELFYDQLSPYGSWVDYENYGYAWVPDVDRDFSPYGSDGHWVFTEDGWTWFSDYSWGWAPFHYGRWAYDNSYGWIWIPQNEWGPAWVTWRRSEGYYGWAPMGPGISIDISFGNNYRVPNERWIFVSDRDINREDIGRHYVDRSTNASIINRSTVINNTYIDNSRHTKYVSGPGRDDVQRVTGRAIRPAVIRENDRPGATLNNDQFNIYRPRVQMNNNNDRKRAPAKVVKINELKRVYERNPAKPWRNENLRVNGKPQVTQPQTGKPPVNNNRNQNREVTPQERNSRNEQTRQRQPVKPPENTGNAPQPRKANPYDRYKRNEAPPKRETVKPPENNGTAQPPRDDKPYDRYKRNEALPKRETVKPPVNSAKPEIQGDLNPTDKNIRSQLPKDGQPVKPTDNNGRIQKPNDVNPSGKNKNMDHQSKPRIIRPPRR